MARSREAGDFVNSAVSYLLFPKSCRLEPPPEAVLPLMASGLEQWNSTSQIIEWLGTMRLAAL